MTPHNNAKKGDYAQSILLPGDPLRAQWVADTFLDDVVKVNTVRNCLGFTGFYKGKRVSVQATGMGQPSLAIYVQELITVYGAQNLIRIGTCGGINTKVKVRDVIIAQAASTDSSIVRDAFPGFAFSPIGDYSLLSAAVERATDASLRWHVGNMVSSDIFYRPNGFSDYEPLSKHGALGVEMECAALYLLAARFGVKALTVCTMTDCLITHEEISAAERQTSLRDMVTLALDVAIAAPEN